MKDIEFLESKIATQINTFKDFKKSNLNDQYFDRISNDILLKANKKTNKFGFPLKPSYGYALLFLVSFLVSLQFSYFEDLSSYSSNSYLFSETSYWIEEEQYLSNLEFEDINLDYENYFSDDMNYGHEIIVNNEIMDLSVNQINTIYEIIKTKKIL